MSEEDVRKEIQRLNDLYIKENDKKILYSREGVDSLIFAKTNKLQQENQQLKDIRETAINYIDQVIMYKPCAREIDKELDILIGILRGGNNE